MNTPIRSTSRLTAVAALGILPLSLSAQTAPPHADDIDNRTLDLLERSWRRIDDSARGGSARQFFDFALEASAADWHPERVEKALAMAETMQDRNAASRTFGNLAWYWGDEKPDDRNAVEFCMQKGVLVWMLHRDRLTPGGRAALKRLMDYSVEGIRRHRVSPSYTNIYLMKLWNCIAMGESTDRPELAQLGYDMLDQWIAYTWECGIHEYVSPTYYGTDLDSLGLLLRYGGRAEGREMAEAALRLFWTDIAANWFEPAARLGGAHSRDYDYLTGHGYLDRLLQKTGWLEKERPLEPSVFLDLCAYRPPDTFLDPMTSQCPRTIVQKWGSAPWESATHCLGHRVCIGSAGATYGAMDKPLTVNLAGGPDMPVLSFFMDARGDPYGKHRFRTGGGHSKALHLEPFLTSVQRGRDVLLLASAQSGSRAFRRLGDETTCLLSQVVLPSAASVLLGNGDPLSPSAKRTPVSLATPVFLRYQDVAVAIRFLLARTTHGDPAPIELVRDGDTWHAMRLTCTHSPERPDGRGVIALWVRVAEGLDDSGFKRFRSAVCATRVQAEADGDVVTLRVPCEETTLRLVADVAKEERLVAEGCEPNSGTALLSVNGRDIGREVLEPLPPVRQCRRWAALDTVAVDREWPVDSVIQAEDAAVLFSPFTIARDDRAVRFTWVPGEEGADGGSELARAAWVVAVPSAGTYRLWGRVKAPTPKDDSFYVRIRQHGGVPPEKTAWHTGLHPEWQWACATPDGVLLAKGRAVVEVHCREDGTRLDALFLGRGEKRPDR